MAAEQHVAAQIRVVYFKSPESKSAAVRLTNRLMSALDVWEPEIGFRVLAPWLGVPEGSTLLWPHLRFPSAALEANLDVCEEKLRTSILGHLTRMHSAEFGLNFDVSTAIETRHTVQP